MKKQFIIFFTILCLLCSYIPALAGSLPYNVKFVNHKGNEVDVSFANGSEPICKDDPTHRGALIEYGNSINKHYFIGWSNKKDFATNDNAKLYYDYEPVQTLINDGVSTVYAIYFSGTGAFSYVNKYNHTYINRFIDDQNTVPGSVRNTDVDTNPNDHDIVLYYDETKDKYNILLESSFTMNKMLMHWLYCGNGYSIMTNTQSGMDSADIGADYTHVDLNVSVTDEIDMPSELSLTFIGNFFQPYMAINTYTREKLTIKETGKETGNWQIKNLVSNSDPSTKFTVINPPRHITIRTILRTNKDIGGKKIPNLSAKTIETQNMKLKCNLFLNIPKDKAFELLNNSQKAKISGVVNGFVHLPTIQLPIINLPHSLSRPITDIPADPVYISFKGKHTPIKPTESIKPINAPQTGDTANIVLYVVLAVVAVGIFVFILSKNKRNK